MRFRELINSPLSNIFSIWELRLILKYLKFCKEDEVADIGTGNGFAAFILSKYVKKVIGIDISKPVIDFLNRSEKPNNVEFLEMDATLDPPEDMLNRFDKVICIDVLQYVKKPENLIKFIEKILKPEGVSAITFPLKTRFRNKEYFARGEVNKLFKSEGNLKYLVKSFRLKYFSFLIGMSYIKFQNVLETTGDPAKFEDEVCFKMMKNPKKIHKLYKLGTILLYYMSKNAYLEDKKGDRILAILTKRKSAI